ncbi:retrotransposon protein, putative, ty1-copia subclass [Tanacetum coccineum]
MNNSVTIAYSFELHFTTTSLDGLKPGNIDELQAMLSIPQAPDRYGFYVDIEEYELGDFNEPPNYKVSLSDPEFDKRLEAMNTKMQSMKDNQVWVLVDFPPNGQTVRSKWLFKKKTDMDGNVHTFKACLVAKGYTQTYGVDYRENFSPVADYEIWQRCQNRLSERSPNRGRIHGATWGVCGSETSQQREHHHLGIKIIHDRSKRLIALSQSAYLEKILKKFWMENFKRGYTLMIEKTDYRKSQVAKTPSEVQRMQRVPYASTIGSIMYAVRCTRPNVAFAKNLCSRFQQNPAELKVFCYADASFQTDKDDTKSQTGYVFVLNGEAVDWKSAKQSTTAMSSIEVEYIAAADASMEAVWMRKFIDGLEGVVPSNKRPMEMLCDNEPTIAIANDPGILKGARHFQMKYHYIREVIQEREIFLKKIHTYDNVANPFTKPMPFNKHYEHAMVIGIVPASSLM